MKKIRDLGALGSYLKTTFVRTFAFCLFHSRLLKIINHFIANYQIKRNGNRTPDFPYVKRRRWKNVQILLYHRVHDDWDPFFPAISVDTFEKHLNFLASEFNICPLEEVIEQMNGYSVPDNAIVITFDDGYKDVYDNAFPILQRLSIPATVFLTTGSVGSGNLLWHDTVFYAFRETQALFLEDFGNEGQIYPLRSLEEKLFAQKEILKFLWSLGEDERSYWIGRLVEMLDVSAEVNGSDLMLTWDEVRLMHASGISFGSHTVSHPILSSLSADRAQQEIYESKRIIEEKLAVTVKTFAYPNGRKCDYNETTKSILKEAGYYCALTTIFGANQNGQDLFELRRGGPWEEYLPAFAAKLNWYKFWHQDLV